MLFTRNFLNIIQLGLGFLFVFTAYQTCANIQAFVIDSVYNNRDNGTLSPPIDSDAGYTSSAIVYGVFTGSNLIAPPIVGAIGEKWSMVLGGLCYLFYLTSFLYITTVFLYVCSAILGVGAAIIWVGQGSYLSKNSNDLTAGRNSGVFWAMFQFSCVLGGLIAFVSFNTDTTSGTFLSNQIIQTVYIVFSVLAALGLVILGFLRRPSKVLVEGNQELNKEVKKSSLNDVAENFLRMIKLLMTKPQLLLMFVFAFTGFEQGFWGGVYGTSLANTLTLSSHKELLALNGIFVGIGETVGGGIFGIFGKQVNRFGRIPVVILGLITNMVAFLLIYLTIASEAPVRETYNLSIISPNQYLALFCSFLLGFADACWNTQIYSLLSTYYAKDSAPAFGLYKLFQSGATCASYFYSGPGQLYLQWQLLIVAIMCPIAGFCFVNAQWIMQSREREAIKQKVVANELHM